MNEEQLRHERSVHDYPEIDLHDDEYVVLSLRRSNIGVFAIWGMVIFCVIALSFALLTISKAEFATNNLLHINDAARHYLSLFSFLLYVLFVVMGFIGWNIYSSNRMWVTNRRVIQKIRNSLFSGSTQIIELIKIEDVSHQQTGFLQTVLHYGTLRMSTIGDETTYTFPMLDTPRDEIETISELIRAARQQKRKGKNVDSGAAIDDGSANPVSEVVLEDGEGAKKKPRNASAKKGSDELDGLSEAQAKALYDARCEAEARAFAAKLVRNAQKSVRAKKQAGRDAIKDTLSKKTARARAKNANTAAANHATEAQSLADPYAVRNSTSVERDEMKEILKQAKRAAAQAKKDKTNSNTVGRAGRDDSDTMSLPM